MKWILAVLALSLAVLASGCTQSGMLTGENSCTLINETYVEIDNLKAEALGLSRAPVREALKRLAEDHLVELVPRSGCFVAELTPDEIEEIYEIRTRLECMALEYAFGRFDLKHIRALKAEFEACRTLAPGRVVKRETELDSQLHKLICQTSGRRNLQEMLQKLRARVQIFRVREASRWVWVPL